VNGILEGTGRWAGRAGRVLLTCLVVAELTVCGSRAAAAAERPNIVFILVDDMRFDSLRYMPNVQRLLVGHGVSFQNMFVVNSWCCPSRTTFLTGNYSHTTGVYTLSLPYGGFGRFRDDSTIATWLHGAGYRTGLFGKYLNGYSEGKSTYVPPGWDRWFAYSKSDDYGRYGYYYNYTAVDDGTYVHFGHQPSDYGTDVVARKAKAFIRGSSKPFFLYAAPFAPHIPAIPAPRDVNAFSGLAPYRPPGYFEKDVSDKPQWVRSRPGFSSGHARRIDTTRLNQLRSLLAVDRMVAGIVQTLQEKGELDNTMIVFSSDNGYLWGEHRWGAKRVAYEPSIHVPMIIRYEPLTSGHRTSTRLVGNIDLTPTWADLTGVSPGASMDGVSLMPILRGTVGSWRHEILIEHLRDGNDPVTTYCAMRTVPSPSDPHPRLYVWYSTGEQELYDLSSDPYELTNMASRATARSIVRAAREKLALLCSPAPPGLQMPG
jgi:N-acetylglucosamine-6-sulfatase